MQITGSCVHIFIHCRHLYPNRFSVYGKALEIHVLIQHVVFFMRWNISYCEWYHHAPICEDHGLSDVGLDGIISLYSIVEEVT